MGGAFKAPYSTANPPARTPAAAPSDPPSGIRDGHRAASAAVARPPPRVPHRHGRLVRESPAAVLEDRCRLAKHIGFWQERARKVRALNKTRKDHQLPPEPLADPFLWIITAGTPISIKTKLKLEAAPGWPAGVYFFGEDLLRIGLVVACELPRDRSTLLVRLMAAGALLGPAIRDLAALPPDAHERIVTERILLTLQQAIRREPNPTPDEQEFTMEMFSTWEEGRAEAVAETRAHDVLTVFRVRGIAVPDAAREHILAEKDADRLKRWHEKAIVATSVSDVLDDA